MSEKEPPKNKDAELVDQAADALARFFVMFFEDMEKQRIAPSGPNRSEMSEID